MKTEWNLLGPGIFRLMVYNIRDFLKKTVGALSETYSSEKNSFIKGLA